MRYLPLLMSLVVVVSAAALPVLAAPAPAPAPAAPGLAGTVTDAAGRPLAAEVEVYRLDAGLMGVVAVGAHGAFRYVGPVEPGSLWRLRTWAKGFRTAETGWFDPSVRGPIEVRLSPMMGSLQVRVTEADGGAVSGTVTLVGPGGALVWERPAERAFGSDLVAGEYRVLVAAPGFVPVARSVTVVAGSTARISVLMSAAVASLGGQVRDAVTGAPLGAAVVELLQGGGQLVGAVTTDASGQFSLVATPAGSETYRLRLSSPGHRTALVDVPALGPGDRRDWSGGDALSLSPLSAAITGTVEDSFGSGRSHQQVVLVLKGYGEVASMTTSESGHFEFSDVVAGPDLQYRVLAQRPGDVADSGWLALRPGGTTQVPLRSRTGSMETFGLGVLTGVVMDPDGAPLAEAKVEVLRRGGSVRTVSTDAFGTFTMRDLPGTQGEWYGGDPYAIRVSKDGYAAVREVTLDGKSTGDVPMQAHGWVQVQAVLQPLTATLQGRVLDLDGRPVAGAAVELIPEGGARVAWGHADKSGGYRLEVTPAPGLSYALRASAGGYARVSGVDASAGVHAGSGLPTVRLTPRASIFAGQVLDPDGRGIPGVSMNVHGPDGEIVASVVTDEQGLYQVSAAVPRSGLSTVTARTAGWTAALAEVPNPPGAGGRVVSDLVLFPVATVVEGHVDAPDGSLVELLAEGQGVIASTLVQNGGYRFDSVPTAAGWVWVRVHGVGR